MTLEELVIKHEGFRAVAYLCPGNVPTIGYGHTRTVKRSDVGVLRITKERALELLRDDLREPRAIAFALTGFSSGPVFRGVASFIFNLGPGALHGKTTQIGRHLANKNFEKAALGMERFVFANGRKLNGLVTRRAEEAALVRNGISV